MNKDSHDGLWDRLEKSATRFQVPGRAYILDVLRGKTATTVSGYPLISLDSFRQFADRVPSLFCHGEPLLTLLSALRETLLQAKHETDPLCQSILRAIAVLEQLIFTAAITAPADLWVIRQVLAVHSRLGTLARLRAGEILDVEEYASKNDLDVSRLHNDFSLMLVRGYLIKDGNAYRAASGARVDEVLTWSWTMQNDYLNGADEDISRTRMEVPPRDDEKSLSMSDRQHGVGIAAWPANRAQIEVGFQLLPAILFISQHLNGIIPAAGDNLHRSLSHPLTGMIHTLLNGGVIERNGHLTRLGARMLARAPGPFGIVSSYYPCLRALEGILRGDRVPSVDRRPNLAASRRANRGAFAAANDALDAYFLHEGRHFNVFIEHAFGTGEATRQRYFRSGNQSHRYFAVDIEPENIAQAVRLGGLPHNLTAIAPLDIARPDELSLRLRQAGVSSMGAVLMVGNGFHEIKDSTDANMINVFRGYANAGFILVFTEESALSDNELLDARWNTYHSGFRYLHRLSGQHLRPVFDRPGTGLPLSWSACVERGGYKVNARYSIEKRGIFPCLMGPDENTPISVSYFCVPKAFNF